MDKIIPMQEKTKLKIEKKKRKNAESEELINERGIAQGGIIGPLMFFLFFLTT